MSCILEENYNKYLVTVATPILVIMHRYKIMSILNLPYGKAKNNNYISNRSTSIRVWLWETNKRQIQRGTRQ